MELRAEVRTLLDSRAFRYIFDVAFAPKILEWRNRLCKELSLPIEDVRGLQHALLAFEEGFEALFKSVGGDLPAYIAKEFGREDE